MGFNFNFFGDSEHRVFNYKPVYFDPEKEERRQLFGKVDGSLDCTGDAGSEGKPSGNAGADGSKTGYTPGKYISGSFRDGNYQRTRTSGANRIQKIIGMVGLILFFVVLYFVAKFYGMILG